MLNRDPGLGGKEIAAALSISLSRLARVFKALKGMSLVDYRNGLRLERVVALLERGGTNFLEAALEAGFGSYAQFHRVFRARLRVTPREYLADRQAVIALAVAAAARRSNARPTEVDGVGDVVHQRLQQKGLVLKLRDLSDALFRH